MVTASVGAVHEEFYATAATIAPLLLLGYTYLGRRLRGDASGRVSSLQVWIKALPAAAVVWTCLCVLGDFARDTPNWRWAVLAMTAIQFVGGMYGMALQQAESSDTQAR
jgi:hypothetical protein